MKPGCGIWHNKHHPFFNWFAWKLSYSHKKNNNKKLITFSDSYWLLYCRWEPAWCTSALSECFSTLLVFRRARLLHGRAWCFFLLSTSVVVKVHFDFPLSLAFFGPAEADWLTEGRDQAQGRRWQPRLAASVRSVWILRSCLKKRTVRFSEVSLRARLVRCDSRYTSSERGSTEVLWGPDGLSCGMTTLTWSLSVTGWHVPQTWIFNVDLVS